MRIIKSIEIKNYKSVISERIDLEDKTALVGANESGKSNILSALNHLEATNQKKEFLSSEQNISVQHSADDKIKISYHINLSKTLTPNVIKLIPELENKLILLTKSGRPNEPPFWSLSISKLPKFGNLVIISPGTKTKVLQTLKMNGYDDSWISENIVTTYFIGGGNIKLSSNPFHKLISLKQISIAKEDTKKIKIENIIRDEILKNVQVYFWRYESDNYLKESILLDDYCRNWEKKKYGTVTGIFKIAQDEKAFTFELSSVNLRKNLIETDKTSRINLLEKKIAKKFNTLFNRSWKTYWGNPIKLKMNYEETELTFRFDDGHDIPPEYRSDGFKWFLTFMINFQSKEKSLSNYILLIDEPGGNLHPRGQKDALAFINKLNRKNQIIYTTHQTFLIDKNQPESIRILDRFTRYKGIDFYPTRVHNIRNERDHILKDQLLRDSLGFTLSDISPINENNVLVEGTFDRNVLQFCNQKYKILDMNSVSIIDCGNATKIKFHAHQYSNSGLNVICLYDSDSIGKKAIEENKFVKDKYKLLISDKLNRTIEDLIPKKIFAKAYQYICSKNKDHLKIKADIKIPYMNILKKSYKSNLSREIKSTIKHELEDKMLELIKKNFDFESFKIFESKLKEINNLF